MREPFEYFSHVSFACFRHVDPPDDIKDSILSQTYVPSFRSAAFLATSSVFNDIYKHADSELLPLNYLSQKVNFHYPHWNSKQNSFNSKSMPKTPSFYSLSLNMALTTQTSIPTIPAFQLQDPSSSSLTLNFAHQSLNKIHQKCTPIPSIMNITYQSPNVMYQTHNFPPPKPPSQTPL